LDSIYYYENLDYQPRVRYTDPERPGMPAILYERPDEVEVAAPASPVARTLVLADNCYPGWRAQIGNTPATIRQTSDGFREVRVPAAKSPAYLVFIYRPVMVLLGMYVTLATVGLLTARAGIRLSGLR
jgi:hypothetical protein